ncbi:hypothetical protein GmHk_15G042894 [Glycine max]|nr:hypothetical protein GmHk_15G042894 [Glycine max]
MVCKLQPIGSPCTSIGFGLERETPKSKTSSYAVCCLKLLQGVDDNLYKEETTRMFVQLNAAYRTLSNPWLRADYDYELGLRSEKSVVGNESGRSKWLS